MDWTKKARPDLVKPPGLACHGPLSRGPVFEFHLFPFLNYDVDVKELNLVPQVGQKSTVQIVALLGEK